MKRKLISSDVMIFLGTSRGLPKLLQSKQNKFFYFTFFLRYSKIQAQIFEKRQENIIITIVIIGLDFSRQKIRFRKP